MDEQDGPNIAIRTSEITSSIAQVQTHDRGSIYKPLAIAGFALHSVVSQSNPGQNGICLSIARRVNMRATEYESEMCLGGARGKAI